MATDETKNIDELIAARTLKKEESRIHRSPNNQTYRRLYRHRFASLPVLFLIVTLLASATANINDQIANFFFCLKLVKNRLSSRCFNCQPYNSPQYSCHGFASCRLPNSGL